MSGIRVVKPDEARVPSWYGLILQYQPEELDGLPIGRYFEAVQAEGCLEADRPGSTCPLNLLPLFQEPEDLFPGYLSDLGYGPGDFPRAEDFHATATFSRLPFADNVHRLVQPSGRRIKLPLADQGLAAPLTLCSLPDARPASDNRYMSNRPIDAAGDMSGDTSGDADAESRGMYGCSDEDAAAMADQCLPEPKGPPERDDSALLRVRPPGAKQSRQQAPWAPGWPVRVEDPLADEPGLGDPEPPAGEGSA